MDLRYPIGKFEPEAVLTESRRRELIDAIEKTPSALRAAAGALSDEQLETPYRPGGWTVRQVVHHVADSHLNAYVRFKLALTEVEPTIKAYEEKNWATLADARSAPIEVSLALLDALHTRWILLLRSLAPADFARTIRHPELGIMSLDKLLGLYAWHGRHHTAHVAGLVERSGWQGKKSAGK